MKVKEGYCYHIKDEFFIKFDSQNLLINKEDNGYRPHFYAIRDFENNEILWMIPISSRIKKYKKIMNNKFSKFKRCNTIVIGELARRQRAFLIQNAFPIKENYIVIEGETVHVHEELAKKLKSYLRDVIQINKCGIKVFFTDVDEILRKL